VAHISGEQVRLNSISRLQIVESAAEHLPPRAVDLIEALDVCSRIGALLLCRSVHRRSVASRNGRLLRQAAFRALRKLRLTHLEGSGSMSMRSGLAKKRLRRQASASYVKLPSRGMSVVARTAGFGTGSDIGQGELLGTATCCQLGCHVL
jgi:hypothetical protein